MKTRPWHGASYYTCNIADDRLSHEGRTQLEIAAITRVSQGAISQILKQSRETGTPNQRPHGRRQGSTYGRQDRALLRMVCYNWFHSSRRIGRRIAVRTIYRRLWTAGYPSGRPAKCPILTGEHRRRCRQWARRHRDWDPRRWRYCVFSDEFRF